MVTLTSNRISRLGALVNRRSATALGLILASFIAALTLAGEANRSTQVWASARAIPAGKVLEASDLIAVRVFLGQSANHYIVQSKFLIGSRLKSEVDAGELIPSSGISTGSTKIDFRSLPIRVARNDFPADLQVNQRVDLFALPMSSATNDFSAVAVANGIAVESIDQRSKEYGSDVGIVLNVPQSLVYQVVANLVNTRIVVVRDGF